MLLRKGYKKVKDIPKEILDELNRGLSATLNLVEGLAIDFSILLTHTTSLEIPLHIQKKFKEYGIIKRMQTAAAFLLENSLSYKSIIQHNADTVRGWSAYMIAASQTLSLNEKFEHIAVLANDPHFGVREWAWLAMRPLCIENLQSVLTLLNSWIYRDENHRRFAIEITRPRGVWCAHLNSIKLDLNLGLPLLEPLKSDPSRYVQNSIGNWLNDASKSNKDWVVKLCERWKKESSTKETLYICRRALRSI